MVTRIWINVRGTGYYQLSNGINTVNCDESDLKEETLKLETELMEETK